MRGHSWQVEVTFRLRKWWLRLLELREVRTECLEAGIWISAMILFLSFLGHVRFQALSFTLTLLPRWSWCVLTFVLFALSFFGYVESALVARRTGAFLSFVFWLVTGLLLYETFPYAGCLHLGASALWCWVWSRVGVDAIKDDVKAMNADDVKLVERPVIIKMPKRA